ncbi:MAG: rRNA pseudouridine synthase [Anaerolineae bacterium]|nr:rRNA pseudouridine synthase [Anaerolineae bacterium]
MAELERVQKLLARAGLGSRRACEEFIRAGRVTVNGAVIALGARADPDEDVIAVDGERVRVQSRFTYVMLNKPRGVVSAVVAQAQEDRPTVRDLVDLPGHLFPVGRLDVESEGLILLTDDGELANVLTHPRYEHTKTYRVLVEGQPSEQTLAAWRRGIVLPDGTKTQPCKINIARPERDVTWLKITMQEGRKRQIREVGLALGHPVKYILRTKLGPLELGDLKPGEWRRLNEDEIRMLQALKQQGQKKSRDASRKNKRRGAR